MRIPIAKPRMGIESSKPRWGIVGRSGGGCGGGCGDPWCMVDIRNKNKDRGLWSGQDMGRVAGILDSSGLWSRLCG